MTAATTWKATLGVTLRWVARILSILCVAVLLLFLFGEADLSEPVRLSAGEVLQMLFFPVGIVAGMVVAWRREALGAAIIAGSLLVFYVLNFLFAHRLPEGFWFLIFASPGLLFGLAWWLSPVSRVRD